jgi:hypothetical protein
MNEKEFFRLAAVWLDCRQHELHVPGDKVWHLLGQLDYGAEMELMVGAVLDRLQ